MARAFLSAGLSALIKRRGFSTAVNGARGGNGASAKISKPINPSSASAASASTSWIPDPVTGYYRPGNKKAEIDAAEMRAQLISRGRVTSK